MIHILANLFDHKMAAKVESLEKAVRDLIHTLYKMPHKDYDILEKCLVHHGLSPDSPLKVKGQLGHLFIKEVFGFVDEIYTHHDDISLGELKEKLIMLYNLIIENQYKSFSDDGNFNSDLEATKNITQFPHLDYFIIQAFKGPSSAILQARAKARTGLIKMCGLIKQIIGKIDDIEEIAPEKVVNESNVVDMDAVLPKVEPADRADITKYDIRDFVRKYGDKVGIHTFDDWLKVVDTKPALKQELITMFNSLERGKGARDVDSISKQVSDILGRYSSEGLK